MFWRRAIVVKELGPWRCDSIAVIVGAAIEIAFSKFKWLLESAKERTVETLWQTCRRLLDQFQETECRNYFRHCGYRYT
jgi:hypothetical protein